MVVGFYVEVKTEVIEAALDTLETVSNCNTKLLPAKVGAVWDEMFGDNDLVGVMMYVMIPVEES